MDGVPQNDEESDEPAGFEREGEEEEEEMTDEQLDQRILELGNEALQNIGYESQIADVSFFFTDSFYIQFFAAAFPNIDLSNLEEAQSEDQMAQNI